MSMELFEFAEGFVEGKISANDFADTYQEMWKRERDLRLSAKDEDSLSAACSTTFLSADAYNPDQDRHEYEISEAQLREQVAEVLKTVRR